MPAEPSGHNRGPSVVLGSRGAASALALKPDDHVLAEGDGEMIKSGRRSGAKRILAEGIYKVQFETLMGAGSGIVVVSGDRIRGGDDAFAYFGKLKPTENGFTADIETKRHSPGRPTVFNMEPVNIQLTGMFDGPNAICTGTAKQVPGLIFKVVLTFVSE